MTTEEKVQKTEELQAPKIEESPEFKDALSRAISQATSKYQSDASTARKEARNVQKQLAELQTQLEQVKGEAEVARLAGSDEDEADRVRQRLQLQRQIDGKAKELTEREERVQEFERRTTLRLLSERYGISVDELDKLETAEDMERTAKDFYITSLEQKVNTPVAPKGPEPAEEILNPGHDVGGGRPAPARDWFQKAMSQNPQDQAEFERKVAEVKRRR